MKKLAAVLLFSVFSLLVLLQTTNAALLDPTGDTSGLVDIIQMDMTFDSENLYIDVAFANLISERGTGNPYDVYGGIDLDVDQNPNTGEAPQANFYGGTAAIGTDYRLGFDDGIANGLAQLLTPEWILIADVPVSFDQQSFSMILPLSLIGYDDGYVDYSAVFGDPAPFSQKDIIPNEGFGTSTPVPIPSAIWLLGSAFIGLVGFRKKFRKA